MHSRAASDSLRPGVAALNTFFFADDAPEKKKFTEDFFNDYVAKGKFITYV